MRSLSVLLASVVVAGAGATAIGAAPATASTPAVTPHATPARAGTFVPVAPFRAADTRSGLGGVRKGALAARHVLGVKVGGRGGVPTSVAAVAVTLTVVGPATSGALIAYAAGAARPITKNMLYPAHRNTSVAAVSKVSGAGVLDVYNAASSGATQLVVDVSGYYVGGSPSTSDPGVFHALSSPGRVYDSRATGGAYIAHRGRMVTLGGHGGVPASGVGAIVATVSVLSPTASGSLILYAHGNDRPTLATTSFAARQPSAEFVVVPTSSASAVDIYNTSAGSLQIVIDVVGYTTAGVSRTAGTVQPRFPARAVNFTVAANATRSALVGGVGGVPRGSGASAVLARMSVGRPAAGGGLVGWEGGGAVPRATNLQFATGVPTADFVVLPVSASGTVAIHNLSSRAIPVHLDVVGFVSSTTITPPATGTSHYIRNITGASSDATTMSNEGCQDAISHSTLTVLEFGAQSKTAPLPSPGVLLTGTTDRRLTDAQVVTAAKAYVDGFSGCKNDTTPVVIAIGTNNSGAYDKDKYAYDPTSRGIDWAKNVVGRVSPVPSSHVTIVGANDIEASFDDWPDAVQHAKDWETAYLDNSSTQLLFNGSLDNCPDSFGVINTGCTTGWTQDVYYGLAYGYHPYRLKALPQVYTVSQATQWVNVDSSGGNKMAFAGALTEYSACPAPSSGCPTASYTAPNGWAALVRGLATLPGSHPVPAVSDLQID